MAAKQDEPLKLLASLFGILSHPVRVKILGILKNQEFDVSHLQQSLGVSQSCVSQHLQQLKLHGLVLERREGKHVFYRLKTPEISHVFVSALQFLVMDMATESEMLLSARELLSIWGL